MKLKGKMADNYENKEESSDDELFSDDEAERAHLAKKKQKTRFLNNEQRNNGWFL